MRLYAARSSTTPHSAILPSSAAQHNVELEIEQEFLTDLAGTVRSRGLGWWFAWPEPLELGELLLQAPAKLNVGFGDLLDTDLFPSHQAVISFARHYRQYGFLRPVVVTKWGRAPVGKEERLVGLIEQRISALVGREPETLRDVAARALAASKGAARLRHRGTKARAEDEGTTGRVDDGAPQEGRGGEGNFFCSVEGGGRDPSTLMVGEATLSVVLDKDSHVLHKDRHNVGGEKLEARGEA